MTETERIILDRWQVRKKRRQKTAFLEFMQSRFPEARVEPCGRSRNLVIGDPERAALVLGAHYDTCAVLPVPNLIMPLNLLGNLLFGLGLGLGMLLAAGLISGLGAVALGSEKAVPVITGLLLIGFYWMLFGGIPNRNTVNDNTSGVCLLVRLLETLPEDLRRKCCFVFFDNEENGLLGSSGFYKAHKKGLANTPMLNFDCVSDGDELVLFPGKKAGADWVGLLEQTFRSRGSKRVTVEKPGRGLCPSDQVHFPQGVWAAAFRRKRFWGLYIGRIHTKRDTVWQEENLQVLTDCCRELLKKL